MSDTEVVDLSVEGSTAGLTVDVGLASHEDPVTDAWLGGLALGALLELASDATASASEEAVLEATLTVPKANGGSRTTHLGVGAVSLGQRFSSPGVAELNDRVADVAHDFGLEVGEQQVFHPLEAALSVTFIVPAHLSPRWTIDELRSALGGSLDSEGADVEGLLIRLVSPGGGDLVVSGVAYRTGEGGLWFAPGQDSRFGALHSGKVSRFR